MQPPQETHRLSTTIDNRGGRIHSLFTSPVLQRTPHGSPDTTHVRGSEVSSVRYVQDHGRAALPKDKDKDNKESTGRRLLNMLRKTLKGSESEEREVVPEIPTLEPFGDVVGCLAVHIKNCGHFTPKISLLHYTNLFIRISINNVVKYTKFRSLLSKNNEKNTALKFGEIKYFSVQVPRRQDDERNNIHLELMQYDNIKKNPLLLGSVQVHLYEVIQKGCFTEEFGMLNKNTFICRLEVEFMFSYGNFGYGFSHQLKPLQKIIEPSMFMNIAPPPERTDPETNVIIPQPVEYPAFLSPDLKVTVGIPSSVHHSNQPSVVRLEKLQQQPRERLEKMKKEYRNLSTWVEKAGYLENILNPKLEHKDSKKSNTNEEPESMDNNQSGEKPENIVTLHVPLVNKEAETTPSELLNTYNKKGLTIPTVNQLDQDDSTAVAPKRVESALLTMDPPVHIIPSLEITEEDKTPPLEEYPSGAVPDEKMKYALFPPEVKLRDKYSGILRTNSSASEDSYSPFEPVDSPSLVDKPCGYKNTNRKGKTVAFSLKEYNSSSFKPEYIKCRPKYKKLKDSFDPFLRDINNKMSVRKREDQDIYKCRNILSAEVIEYEDQDPPYPEHSKTTGPTNKNLAHDPNIIRRRSSDTENKLVPDPAVNTIETVDTKNKLKERLPTVSSPSCFQGESSATGNANTDTCLLSKSLSLNPHIENLKQSMVLKSILSKNLQDLSDKLFSKPEVYMNTEARKKSRSPPLSIHDKPSSGMEDKVFEKIQDLNSWLSEKDILNSKALLSQVIKNIPADSISEGGPEESPEVQECVSEKHLEADEINFPMKKKSSFKKKHLIDEVPSSKSGVNGFLHDCVIKQIFTAPILSELEIGVKELSKAQVNFQDQLPTPWERNLSSHISVHYKEKDDEIEFPQAKSVVSQIIQAFPINSLLESGIVKVIELDKEHQESSLLGMEIAFPEEKPKDSTKDYSEIKSKTKPLSEKTMPIIPKETTSSINRIKFIEEGQNMSPQDLKYSVPDKKPYLPSNCQRLDREENDLSSTLENLSSSFIDNLNESDTIMFKSFLKNIFKVFFKYNPSERKRQPEKELERLIEHSFPSDTEHLEEIQGNFDKTDKLDRKPVLSPKLRVFLEELSESEVKNLKSELSKQIQHYLVERLSESGHITKEDLPKIYQNLHLMNEKAEPKGQNIFQEKYSETVKEIMMFVNNFNHHFIDKHLEIKLRSFLNEILQNYFLKNFSESSLFNETEHETIHSDISSIRTESSSISFRELGQDISKGSFGRRLEINLKYPLNKPLQNYLIALSENELLNLKVDLSKHLQSLFIEKLAKSGQVTERQLEGIYQHINLLNSSLTPLKYIKTYLPFRDENHFTEEHSEKQNKYSKNVQKNTLQNVTEDKLIETELIRKEEKEYFHLHNLKENSSTIREKKSYYPNEGAKTLSLIKVQPSSNKNIQAIPLNKSSERLTDIVLKKQKKERGFMQLPQAENSVCKAEVQDPYNWSGKSKITQSKACFERTLKMKPLGKKDHINICELTDQEKPEAVLSLYPRIPNCRMPREDEEYLNRLTFPSWHTNTHFNSETWEKSKLEDQYCQRLKGNNNNNKKHLVTFAQCKREIQFLYIKPNEICNEKCAKFPESQSFKYKVVEDEKNSKPSLFPEVLKRENLTPKVRKERDHVAKPKKSFNKVVRMVPTPLPTTRIHLRKSVPRTLLHWTARRTIHDCSDKFEELQVTSFKHLKKAKSRARLLGKNPDDSHNQAKHSARPYTAPEVNKRQESYTGKSANPQMVSAGLVHINDKTSDYEMRKMQPKKILKDVEKRSLICDIIQTLNSSE